jgi:RNA polymerase sigma factor (sigma-70 family)
MISLLSQLIDALPDQQREIISRRYFNEEKIADIAAGMGLSEYQVRTYGADAINKLKINALKVGKLQGLLLVALLEALLR